MNSNEFKVYHRFSVIPLFLICLYPAAQISGPFLTDLFLILIAVFFLFSNKNDKEFRLFETKYWKIFLIFYIYITIRSFFVDDLFLSLKSTLPYLRFIIFSLAIFYFFKKNNNLIKYFYIILFITLCLLIFDGYFQFLTEKNIFGFKQLRPDRLGGLFFDELILGSYLQKIIPIFLTFYFYNKDLINKKIIFIFLLLSYFLIFLSGERASFLLVTLFFILFLPFFFSIKKIFLLFISVLILMLFFINFNTQLKSRWIEQMTLHTFHKGMSRNIFMPDHIGLFTSAIDIFKKNLFIGSGVKTFRIYCKDVAEEDKVELKKDIPNVNFCSTHPHNYYLQLLAETGLVGFSMIAFVFLSILASYFKLLIFWLKNKKENIKKSYACILSSLVTTFWPLTTTGNFFNNWNSSMIFLTLGVYLFVKSNDR